MDVHFFGTNLIASERPLYDRAGTTASVKQPTT